MQTLGQDLIHWWLIFINYLWVVSMWCWAYNGYIDLVKYVRNLKDCIWNWYKMVKNMKFKVSCPSNCSIINACDAKANQTRYSTLCNPLPRRMACILWPTWKNKHISNQYKDYNNIKWCLVIFLKGFPLGRDQEHIIEFVGTTFHDYTLLTLQVV